MAHWQNHHITYVPEWTVELNMLMHRCISRIQNTKATAEQYRHLVDFQHAVSYEANRMRMELDTGLDLRVFKDRPPKPEKPKKAKKPSVPVVLRRRKG